MEVEWEAVIVSFLIFYGGLLWLWLYKKKSLRIKT